MSLVIAMWLSQHGGHRSVQPSHSQVQSFNPILSPASSNRLSPGTLVSTTKKQMPSPLLIKSIVKISEDPGGSPCLSPTKYMYTELMLLVLYSFFLI